MTLRDQNQNVADINPLAISSVNTILKQLQMSYTMVRIFLRKILNMYPNKLQL